MVRIVGEECAGARVIGRRLQLADCFWQHPAFARDWRKHHQQVTVNIKNMKKRT